MEYGTTDRKINFYVDSVGALLALDAAVVKSRLVLETIQLLNEVQIGKQLRNCSSQIS